VDAEGELDLNNPLVKRDLADISQPASAIGYICAGLKLRMEAGKQPFTVRSLAAAREHTQPPLRPTHFLRAFIIGFTRCPSPKPWS
jgi:mannitol-1-phosphate/altronate dehydrogenase